MVCLAAHSSSAGSHAATGRSTRTPGRVQPAGRVAAVAPRPSSSGATLQQQQQHHQLVQALPHAAAAASQRVSAAGSGKYQRILAFVNSQATPSMVGDSWPGSCSSSFEGEEEQQQAHAVAAVGDVATSSWHHSYDEEADEGEDLLHEPHLLAACSARTAAVATAAAAAAPMLAAPAWSYGSTVDPKPFFFSWDEEAEGSFELATAAAAFSSVGTSAAAAVAAEAACLAAAAQDRAARRMAMHEARHAARMIRRLRRAQLHAQLGDLERMPAYVQEQQQAAAAAAQQRQRSAASARYQQLLALVVGEGVNASQYRKPTRWNLTFDEDVHGPEAPETVLGSC